MARMTVRFELVQTNCIPPRSGPTEIQSARLAGNRRDAMKDSDAKKALKVLEDSACGDCGNRGSAIMFSSAEPGTGMNLCRDACEVYAALETLHSFICAATWRASQ